MLTKYTKPIKGLLIFALFIAILEAIASVVMPYVFGIDLVAGIIASGKFVLRDAFLPMLVFGIYLLFHTIKEIILSLIKHKTVSYLREGFVSKCFALPLDTIQKYESGDLLSRLSSDTENVSSYYDSVLPSFVTNGIVLIGSVTMMIYLSPKFALLVLIALVIFGLSMIPLSTVLSKIGERIQERLGSLVAYLSQRIRNVMIVKTSDNINYEYEKSKKYINEVRDANIKGRLISNLVSPILSLILTGVIIFIISVGVQEIASGNITIGILTSFLMYAFGCLQPLGFMGSAFAELSLIKGSRKRLEEFFNEEEINDDNRTSKLNEVFEDKLIIKNLTFNYDSQRDIFSNLNLIFEKGNFYGIVGPSGSGKSTLLYLILQLYNYSGSITLDDIELKDILKSDIYKMMAYVPQSPEIMSGSFVDNICYGLDYDEVLFKECIDKASLNSLINKLENGKDTLISEDGGNFSGGELLRIAFARALYRKPQILLLDEITSGLDNVTEQDIISLIEDFKYQGMVIMISHKLSSVASADCIYLFNESGEIVANGTHNELIENSEEYRNYYQRLNDE